MRSFSILNKLGIAMTLTISLGLTGCDDPMAAAIKAEKQAEGEKAKADAEKHKADLARENERDKLELEREKERNRMELEREKLRIAEESARTTGTGTSTTNINANVDTGGSVGERTQETVKPGDEGAALGGSDGPSAPTTGSASDTTATTK